MSRVKIAEFTAKQVLFPALDLNFQGVALTADNYRDIVRDLPPSLHNTNLVVKVDQGIKKRGLQGLVKVNVTASDLPAIIQSWQKLGWSNFLVEPVVEHAPSAEHYLALERTRGGWQVSYTTSGGVEVESSWDSVQQFILPYGVFSQSQLPPSLKSYPLNLPAMLRKALQAGLQSLFAALDQHHISFLEMNPVLLRDNQLVPLDMACEVDSAGSTLPALPPQVLSESEKSVAALDASTPASLKFKLLNPEGKIWMLLSGGGASLVLADEVADLGLGSELANYGEYSGAPTDDDVYSYTKIILSQLLKSKSLNLPAMLPKALQAGPKSLVIAGGVANFTDVAKTFRGLIRALDEQQKALVKAKVKVFVRRGGPNETQGLMLMHDFLTQSKLLGSIHGHDTPLTQVVSEVKEYLHIHVGADPRVRPKKHI